jgi:hypothetical protein
MFSLLAARLAAVAPARGRPTQIIFVSRTAAAIVTAASLAGCMSDRAPIAMAGDPASPSAPSASVGYRSTIAPYSSLRPSTPQSWRERNHSVTPPARTDR